jgi:orotidine-5'-phosphate decarboxylase
VEGRDYVIPDDVKRLVIPGIRAPRGDQRARTSLAQRSTERASGFCRKS